MKKKKLIMSMLYSLTALFVIYAFIYDKISFELAVLILLAYIVNILSKSEKDEYMD